MGGSIEDAFGGIGPILLPMAIAGFGIIFSIIGTLLVKITDQDAKNNKFKSIKYWKLGFYCLNGNCLFLSSKVYVACNYENGILGEGMQDISSMRVFYATIVD
jgi:K(+)-stimulated pyrophosphate-energized sodium pump